MDQKKRNNLLLLLQQLLGGAGIVFLLLLTSCGNAAETEQTAGTEEEVRGQEIDFWESQVVCDEAYFAYITEEGRVFCAWGNGETYFADYVPEAENIRKIYGASNGIYLFGGDGSIRLYDVPEERYVTAEETETDGSKWGRSRDLFRLIAESTSPVTDFVTLGFGDSFFAVRGAGGWFTSYLPERYKDLAWEEAASVIGNASEPDAVLYRNGTVEMFQGMTGNEGSRRLDWEAVQQIAEGESLLGLSSDGSVYVAQPDGMPELDVSDWSDIRQISACIGVTAGLRRDGTVLVRSRIKESFHEAEGWSDICYIKVCGFYLLGIARDGTIYQTSPESSLFSLEMEGDVAYPKPAVCGR